MIDSVEENWDVTYIMQKARIARTVRRSELEEGQRLEDAYFEVTEGEAAQSGGGESEAKE